VIDHQAAPLRFQLFGGFNQLLALPMDSAQLLFSFARHAH
jgi:hypothetical protein